MALSARWYSARTVCRRAGHSTDDHLLAGACCLRIRLDQSRETWVVDHSYSLEDDRATTEVRSFSDRRLSRALSLAREPITPRDAGGVIHEGVQGNGRLHGTR
jgi:hypothetical protein